MWKQKQPLRQLLHLPPSLLLSPLLPPPPPPPPPPPWQWQQGPLLLRVVKALWVVGVGVGVLEVRGVSQEEVTYPLPPLLPPPPLSHLTLSFSTWLIYPALGLGVVVGEGRQGWQAQRLLLLVH